MDNFQRHVQIDGTPVVGISSSAAAPVDVRVSSSLADPVFVQVSGIVFSGTVTASIGPVDQGNSGSQAWLVTGTVHADNPFNGQVHETGTAAVSGVGVFQVTGSVGVGGTVAVSSTQFVSSDPTVGAACLPVRMLLPSTHLSAFGELQTVQKVMVVGLNFNYSINPEFAVTSTLNGGTATHSSSMAVLQTTANPSGSAVLESSASCLYFPGNGIFQSYTALFTSGVASSSQIAGLGDSNNGLFWGYSGSQFGAWLRNGGVDAFTPTGSFSLDHLDGTGPSGYTIAPTTLELFKVDFGWHGSGPCKWSIFDVVHGRWILAHVTGANVTAPRLTSPNLPIHYEATNLGNTSNLTVKGASAGIYRESVNPAIDSPSFGLLDCTGTNKSITSGSVVPLVSYQVTGTFNGLNNRVQSQVIGISVADREKAGGNEVLFRLVKNPTLTSASFSPISLNIRTVNADVAATAVSGGKEVWRHLQNAATSNYIDLSPLELKIGPNDVITVVGEATFGNAAVSVGLDIREEFFG